jgi:2'-5' RNA ligase
MPRLFVALDFPLAAMEALERLRPAAGAGVRVVDREQLHLTLHFLGDYDRDRVAAALGIVEFRPICLDLNGVGKFVSRDGGTILWAGVRASAELTGLHAAIGSALSETGFRPESRPYSPHVTLARCRPSAARDAIAEFLQRNQEFAVANVQATSFGLYSSEIRNGVRTYGCESSYSAL